MPRVPLPTEELRPTAAGTYNAPSVAPPDSAYGAQLARLGDATTNFGSTLVSIGAHLQDQVDEARAQEGVNRLRDRYRQALYDPNNGYFNTQGFAARDQRQERFAELDTTEKEIDESLENDVQRSMFRKAAGALRAQELMRADKHEFEQVRVANIGVTTQARDDHIRAFAETGDTAELNRAYWKQEKLSELNGARPEIADAENAKVISDAHEARIQALLQADPAEAAKHWKAHKKDILLERRQRLARDVEHATAADDSLRLAIQIEQQVFDAPQDPKQQGPPAPSYTDTLKAANNPGNDPAVLSTYVRKAEAELRRRFEAGEIDAQRYGMALQKVEEDHRRRVNEWNGVAQATLLDVERFHAANPGVTSVQSPDFPTALRSQLIESGQLDAANKALRPVRTRDDAAYFALLNDHDNGRLAGMSEAQLFNRYYAHLDEAGWNEAQMKHAEANKRSSPKLDSYVLKWQDDVRRMASEANGGKLTGVSESDGFPKPASPDEAKWWGEFQAKLDEKLRLRATKTGEITREAILQEAQQLLLDKATLPGLLWGGTVVHQQFDPIVTDDNRKDLVAAGRPLSDFPGGEQAQRAVVNAYRLDQLTRTLADPSVIGAARAVLESNDEASIESLWLALGMSTVDPPSEWRMNWLQQRESNARTERRSTLQGLKELSPQEIEADAQDAIRRLLQGGN